PLFPLRGRNRARKGTDPARAFLVVRQYKQLVDSPEMSADDVGVELVAGSLAMLTRQANLIRLHELVSARGGLTLERSAYPLLNQILALQGAAGGGRLTDVAAGLKVAVPTVSRQVRQLEDLGLVARTQDPIDGR